jgi:hypothetical protein
MSPRVCLIKEKENYHETNEYPNKMSGKSDKLQSHKKKSEKKSGESRKYGNISYDSVSCAAETNGLLALSEEIRKQLSEDVSYRLREVIHVSCVRFFSGKLQESANFCNYTMS